MEVKTNNKRMMKHLGKEFSNSYIHSRGQNEHKFILKTKGLYRYYIYIARIGFCPVETPEVQVFIEFVWSKNGACGGNLNLI